MPPRMEDLFVVLIERFCEQSGKLIVRVPLSGNHRCCPGARHFPGQTYEALAAQNIVCIAGGKKNKTSFLEINSSNQSSLPVDPTPTSTGSVSHW